MDQRRECHIILYIMFKGDSELISILFSLGATELSKIMKGSISPWNIMCYHIEREVMCCSTYTSSRSVCLGVHGTDTLEALLGGLCMSSIFQLTNMLEKCNFP